MIDKDNLSKIGIGTWGIGGFDKRDSGNDDARQIDAIRYMLEKGINYVETTLWYSEGHAAEILADALSQADVGREKVFISQSIYPHQVNTLQQAESEVSQFLDLIGSDRLDTLQFTMNGIYKYGIEQSMDFFNDMLKANRTRYVSITNSDLETLELMHKGFREKFFSHELAFNFEIRNLEELGITGYAMKNNILNVVLQPLRRNKTAMHNWGLLSELSKKYGKTQNQLILNWISSKGFLPLVKSENISHIDENLAAFDFNIEDEDIRRMNDWRPPDYKSPEIDWRMSGKGVAPHKLPNTFDAEYERQTKQPLH